MVFIPKYRRKALYGQLRKDLGGVFRRLAAPKACRVEDGHLMAGRSHQQDLTGPSANQGSLPQPDQPLRERIDAQAGRQA